MDDENKLPMGMQPKVEDANVTSANNSTCHIKDEPVDDGKIDSGSSSLSEYTTFEELGPCDQTKEVQRSLASVKIEDGVSDDKGYCFSNFASLTSLM